MTTNTLVTHKKNRNLGIGCISKVLSKSYRVNFGLDTTKTVAHDMVEAIDVSNCKTVSFQEFRSRILSEKSTLNECIVGNEVRHYVGIGWLVAGVVTHSDLLKLPRVI